MIFFGKLRPFSADIRNKSKVSILNRQVWILILLVAVAFDGCGKEQTASTDQAAPTDRTLRPDSEVSGARIYLYDRGRVTTEIVAEKVVKFESLDSTMAYTLDIDIYGGINLNGEILTEKPIISSSS